MADQSQSNPATNSQDLKSSPTAESNSSTSTQSAGSDDDFVDVSHEDSDTAEGEAEHSSQGLSLQRFGNNIEDVHEEEEPDHMSHHPLLGMLAGRIGGGRRRGSVNKWDHLHPVTQVLSVANVNDCTELEEEAFPPDERASREKFEYRLTRCPELSLGLFTQPTRAETEASDKPPKKKLLAQIVSTRTPSPSVTDASMALPADWRTNKSTIPSKDGSEPEGHQDQGGTICIHSVAVAKEHQKLGLGTVLMKAYIQRIKDSKIADRLALLAHKDLIHFYSGFGFEDMGPSSVTACGGNWINMVLHFDEHEED